LIRIRDTPFLTGKDRSMNGALLRQAILSVLVASSSARSETAGPPPGQPADPTETLVVIGKRVQPLSRIAAPVDVISGDDMAADLSRDVRDAVRYEPALSVPTDPVRFGTGSLAIRGIGGNRVAIEIDGVPAADGFGIGSYSLSGRGSVDLAFVDRLEILRGPASVLYGSDAVAGVAAFYTLDPEDLVDASGAALRLQAGLRSDDRGRDASGVAAWRGETRGVLAGISWRNGHERAIAGTAEPDPRDAVALNGLVKLTDELSSGRLELTLEGGSADVSTRVDALVGLPGRFADTLSMNADDHLHRHRASLEGDVAGNGLWRLYVQDYTVRQDTLEMRAAAPPRAPEPVRIERRFDMDTTSGGGELTLTDEFTAWGFAHALVYGVEFDASRIVEERDGRETRLVSGATSSVLLGENMPVRDFPTTEVLQAGAYLQDEVSGATGRWSIIPAVRIDLYRLRPRGDSVYSADNPTAEPVSVDTRAATPRLGFVYRYDPQWSMYAQYARGFRAPPFEDVNIGLELPQFNIRAIPNPDLEPEKSDGFELGVRGTIARVAVDAAAYLIEFSDFIESKVNLGPDPETGTILFQSRNVAEARIYGIETGLTLRLDEFVPGLELRAAALWARGEDTTQHVTLTSVDPAQAIVALAWDAPSRRAGGRAVITVTDRVRHLDTSSGVYAPDGWATLDLYGHAALGGNMMLRVSATNLTDAHYVTWADVRGRKADDPLLPYFTQPGRAFAASLEWRF
jgi:hemoglobin/transferrin/lactoferrin receptor protein